MIKVMQNVSTTYVSINPTLATCENKERRGKLTKEIQKDSLCLNDCKKLFEYLTSLQKRQIFFTFQELESAQIEDEQRKIETVMEQILLLGCERQK